MQKYEKQIKWAKLGENTQLWKAFVMPLRDVNEPYLRSFQY